MHLDIRANNRKFGLVDDIYDTFQSAMKHKSLVIFITPVRERHSLLQSTADLKLQEILPGMLTHFSLHDVAYFDSWLDFT